MDEHRYWEGLEHILSMTDDATHKDVENPSARAEAEVSIQQAINELIHIPLTPDLVGAGFGNADLTLMNGLTEYQLGLQSKDRGTYQGEQEANRQFATAHEYFHSAQDKFEQAHAAVTRQWSQR